MHCRFRMMSIRLRTHESFQPRVERRLTEFLPVLRLMAGQLPSMIVHKLSIISRSDLIDGH